MVPISKEIRQYIDQLNSVEGWFSGASPILFALLNSVQQKLQVSGDIFEIGVYQGKSAILLGHLVDIEKGEKLLLNDTFSAIEDQERHFWSNWQRFGPRTSKPVLIKKDSRMLSQRETGRNIRFFHVDGGHSLEVVSRDLDTARRALQKMGVIAVDDAFDPRHPAVAEALYRFLDQHPDIRPFLLESKKAYLARQQAIPSYQEALKSLTVKDFLQSELPKYELFYKQFWNNQAAIVFLRPEYWRAA